MLLAELAYGLRQYIRKVVQSPVYLAEVQPQDDDLVALDRVLEEADVHRYLESREQHQFQVGQLR